MDTADEQRWKYTPDGFIENIHPLTFSGSSTCWILIHGYTNTPEELRALGQRIHGTYGDTVYIPLLLGHGQRASDLERYTVEDRYQQISNLADEKQCDYIMGSSLGASLALRYAEEHEPKNLIIVSVPLAQEPTWLPSQMTTLIWRTGRYLRKTSPGETIDDPQGNASHIASANFPLKGAVELIAFNKAVIADLKNVRANTLIIHALHDTVMNVKGARDLNMQLKTNRKLIILQRGDHIIFEDYHKDAAIQAVLNFRAAHTQALNNTVSE